MICMLLQQTQAVISIGVICHASPATAVHISSIVLRGMRGLVLQAWWTDFI